MGSLTKYVSDDHPEFAVFIEDDDKVCYAYLWKECENIIAHEWFESNSQGVYTDLAMDPFLRSLHFGFPALNTYRGYNLFNNSVVFRSETLCLT